MDMKVNIAGVEWKNPVTVASGTFGSGEEFSEFVDLNRLGAVTTKGVANVPWPGNPTPRVAEVYGGMMNAIGLQNPGIDLFCKRDIPFLKKYDTKIIVNVCGHAPEEYLAVVERLADEPIDMMEINISCPNVNAGFLAFGQDAKHVEELTAQIKKIAKQPIIMKLTPNVTDITEIAKAAEAGGADALSLINTLTGMKIDINRRTFAVANKTGGVSGPVVHPIAVRMVYQTAQAVNIPIIGMGGIAGHMFVDMPADRTGYLHKASLLQDMSAVTAACLLMKKEVFEQAGGFTEELAVAFNDVDLCLKVRKNGYLIVYDPYAKLYHMESKTRGAEDSKEKVRRFQTEIEYMRCHWIDILKNGDPCYNKNLSLTKWNYSLKPILGMETEAGQKKEKTGRKSCRKYQ